MTRFAITMALVCTAAFGGAFLVTHQLTASQPASSAAARPAATAEHVTMPSFSGHIVPLRVARPKRVVRHRITSATASATSAPAATAAPTAIVTPHVATSAPPVHASATTTPKPTARRGTGYGSGGTTAGAGGSSAGG